jgi:hypothetical protein
MKARMSATSSPAAIRACEGGQGQLCGVDLPRARLERLVSRQDRRWQRRSRTTASAAVFFQPFYAGQTFGIGQLNPLTALQMSDTVARVSGLPKLDYRNPTDVYATIMDPDQTLPYVAATLKKSIDAYASDRRLRHFDQSRHHRDALQCRQPRSPRPRAEGRKRAPCCGLARNRSFPEENYYGWLVNDRIADLKALFSEVARLRGGAAAIESMGDRLSDIEPIRLAKSYWPRKSPWATAQTCR